MILKVKTALLPCDIYINFDNFIIYQLVIFFFFLNRQLKNFKKYQHNQKISHFNLSLCIMKV